MKYYVGADIGGTNTKIGVLDHEFNILKEVSIKTNPERGARDSFERIWKEIVEIFNELNLNIDKLEGIGLGIPGPVVKNSIVKIAANFSWGDNFNAKELLEEISGKKVVVENDVRLIAIGEQRFGAAKGYENAIVIPIGTGVAAGIIVNNKIITGMSGAAGEFGHISIELNQEKCGCGLVGCLEKYCSGPGIKKIAKEVLSKNKSGILYEKFKNNLEAIDAYDVFKGYRNNDEVCKEIIDIFSDKLAHGIGILINILNTEIVVLAGGVSKSADIIIEKVQKHIKKYALGISLEDLKIVKGTLLDQAGIKGSATLIIESGR